VEDNVLMQLVSEPTRGGDSLDLLFTNREGLGGDVVVEACLGLSNHEMTEFLLKSRGKSAKPLPWASRGQTLACSEHWLRESLGRQP